MNFVWAFLVGGLICVVGQLLIDLTKLTPARILVLYVVAGVVLSALGWYEDRLGSFAFDTGANGDPDIPIRPGPMLWERVRLSDGSSGRLVTSFYERSA